jgi:hypothetical protein
VQRLIERQAVSRPAEPALISEGGAVTYRDLNLRANAVARRLVAHGVRRRSTVVVKMDKSADAAVVLLAVLKAGAAYMWLDAAEASPWPCGVSCCEASGLEERWKTLDLCSMLSATQPAPNLPILTRGTDIACVLPKGNGAPGVLVPHETITGLPVTVTERAHWNGDAGALGLLVGLMSGATISITGAPVSAAAA